MDKIVVTLNDLPALPSYLWRVTKKMELSDGGRKRLSS